MSINFSTGAKAAMLGSTGLKAATAAFFLDIYTGARPLTADAPVSGTKLVRISLNGTGTGLTFLDPDALGAINKDSAVVWRGIAIAAGTMGYARLQSGSDSGASSTSAIRLDFNVGTSSDLSMNSLTCSITPVATPHSVDQASLSM